MTRTKTDASAAPLAEHERVLAWCPVRGMHLVAEADGGLLAADSWLVREGSVREIGRHAERFMNACSETTVVPTDHVREFWREALAAVPRQGHWFPRVELGADESARLRLRLRPAPPLASQVRVWVSDRPDPRLTPRRKGPDLPALARLRQEAAGHGAQEALLSSSDGLVLEAANSSLLWWEDDTMCLPAPTLPILPGVTTSLIQERARSAGTPVVHRHPTLDDLDGREVWLVNALHGIRPVTAWTGRALRARPATRAAEWRRWLDGLGLPL